jgi:hypothetical protein
LTFEICIEPRDFPVDKKTLYEKKYKRVCRRVIGDWGGFSVEDSREIIEVGYIKARSLTTLSMFEVCDVRFERTLAFDKDNFHVEITLSIDPEKAMNLVPEYFVNDKKNCFGDKRWDLENNKDDLFYKEAEAGNVPDIIGRWFELFDRIIDTVNFS